MDLENIVKNKNIRLTPARRSILDVLIKANKPLCYEDVKLHITMDKATFYRNISIFENDGLVNSFESNDKKRYFFIEKTNHPHFICNLCSNIQCIKEQININIKGYIINTIILKGICKNCT